MNYQAVNGNNISLATTEMLIKRYATSLNNQKKEPQEESGR